MLKSTFPAVLACLALFATGCATYRDQTRPIRNAWVAGDDMRAAALAREAAENRSGSRDAVVYRLEEGAALRAAHQYIDSNRAFDLAEQDIMQFDAGAEIRLAAEMGAALTNLSALPYTGFAYDKIMLSTYKALNFMQLGELEAARVELNRALERQREAVRDNAARLEEARAKAAETARDARGHMQSTGSSGTALDLQRTHNDPRLQRQLDAAYAYLDEYRVYADYVNPFTVFLDGLFFFAVGQGQSDLERARLSWERVRAMVLDHRYINEDLDALDRRMRGETLPPLTYVIFETGTAPLRDEVRIDLPLVLVGSRAVPYVGVNFPRLDFQGNYLPRITARADGHSHPTATIARMDSVIAQEFANELPAIVVKTLLSAGAKAAIQYGLYEATKDHGTAGLLVMLAGTLYQAAMNQADLRTWTTLPKQFAYCRFPTPENLEVEISGGRGSKFVHLEKAPINVIYVKSNSANAPLNITTFTLDPRPPGTL